MSTELSAALSEDEFARLIEKSFSVFPSIPRKIAVAVSGGPDSMALAFCLKRWAQCEMIALIVDHGLRAEAAAEAAQVKSRLEQSGIEAEILRWTHQPVTARLHETARKARYALLTQACKRLNAQVLLVAHQREDQAETILMRFAKGSGIEGLTGMKAHIMRDDVHILRPFLSVPKQRLIATCAAAHMEFVTDPANNSEKFARGRLRKIMPLLENEGMSVENLLTLGERAAEADAAINHYAHGFLKIHAQCEIGGSIRLNRDALRKVPRAVAFHILKDCLRHIHDDGHPPEYKSLSALCDALRDAPPETARTLNGCILSVGQDNLFLLREPAAATEILPLRSGETILWDGRWRVSAANSPDPTPAYTVRALGNPPHDVIDRLAPRLRHDIPQGRIRATLPAIFVNDTLCAIPSFDEAADFHMVPLGSRLTAYDRQTKGR